ncbi:MAG: helix-turn-helix transcriptional regulator [Gemmatimonadaceae bacterium]
MALSPNRAGNLRGTRGRIVGLLRRSSLSANEIAAKLGVTHNAVRGHLATLLRSGIVREGGKQRGVSRPAALYELVPRAESVLSGAYIPFVAHLLRAIGERSTEAALDDLMRNVGRSLAAEWPRLHGNLEQRVDAANALLVELGALTEVVTESDGFVIRGYGCLLAEAVHGRPEVCRAMESLLAELLQVPVDECCTRGERPQCCFRIDMSPGSPTHARPT